MQHTKIFPFDALLDEADTCNQKNEIATILQALARGIKLLVYGHRNYGKTSIVKNVVGQRWRRENPDGLFFYVDLMGVTTLAQISERMTLAFSKAYNRSFKFKGKFQSLLKSIKQLRPTLEIDESGTPKLALSFSPTSQTTHFVEILRHIGIVSQKVKTVIVLDKF